MNGPLQVYGCLFMKYIFKDLLGVLGTGASKMAQW